jgi:hypothetical protein
MVLGSGIEAHTGGGSRIEADPHNHGEKENNLPANNYFDFKKDFKGFKNSISSMIRDCYSVCTTSQFFK